MRLFPWRRLSLLLTILWAGLIFYQSHQSDPGFQPSFAHQDKIMHFTAYAILGILAMGSARMQASGGYRQAVAWRVCLLAGLYGVSDELHQHFIPGRTADILDIVADLAGVMAGAWLVFYLARQVSGASRAIRE